MNTMNQEKKAPRTGKRFCAVCCALCLIAGLVIGFLAGRFTAQGLKDADASAPDAKVESIAVFTNETPVLLRYPSEDAERPAWFYAVNIEDTAGKSFTVEQVTLVYISEQDEEGNPLSYTPQQLFRNDGLIEPYGRLSFNSGIPMQDVKGVRVTVTGTDANGDKLTTEAYFPFSKRIAES